MGNITIDINGDCNLNCKFCYQLLEGSQLSTENILSFIDDHPLLQTVEIGGGEPFMYENFSELITKITGNNGKKVHIATNGTFIPKGFLDLENKIREAVQVQVSLHASNPMLYEQITGKNKFEKVIENTKKLHERYSTSLTAAIYSENYNDVENIVDLADSLQIPLRINLVFPVGKGKDVVLLNEKQVDQLRGYLLGKRLVYKMQGKASMLESPLIHTNNCTAITQAYGILKSGSCPADCKKKAHITPYGKVSSCEFLNVSS